MKTVAFSLLFLWSLAPARALADPFLPNQGWTCQGSTPQFPYLNADVLPMAPQSREGREGRAITYRVRVLTSSQESGESPTKFAIVDGVDEQVTEQAYLYVGASNGVSTEIKIRKVQGSDHGLSAVLKVSGIANPVRLLCDRTRPN